jgi:hypothetical protein
MANFATANPMPAFPTNESLPEDQPLVRPGVVVQALAPPVPTFTQNVFYKVDHLKRYPAVPLLLQGKLDPWMSKLFLQSMVIKPSRVN